MLHFPYSILVGIAALLELIVEGSGGKCLCVNMERTQSKEKGSQL